MLGNPWAAGVGLAVVGVASTTVSVVGGWARQMLTPDNVLGRVVSATRLLGIGSAGIGAMVGGSIARGGGLYAPLIVAPLLLAVLAAAFGVRRRTT